MIALDASALLAFYYREPGHERVAEALGTACISAVNLAEVLFVLARRQAGAAAALPRVEQAPIEVAPFTAGQASATAGLAARTARFGLSLGDRACSTLARERGIAALTADRAWKDLDVGTRIELMR